MNKEKVFEANRKNSTNLAPKKNLGKKLSSLKKVSKLPLKNVSKSTKIQRKDAQNPHNPKMIAGKKNSKDKIKELKK